MKQIGSVVEFTQERLDDIMRVYDEYIEKCSFIRMSDVYETIANSPASRFWVSDVRAALVISAMMRGEEDLSHMRPLKREMFKEIYRRVIQLQKKHPDCSIIELCSDVVMQPAPKFYHTPGSIRVMVCKAKAIREWKRKKMKKLEQWL